jgi:predicted DNA-binding transcriptional regulator AlpA
MTDRQLDRASVAAILGVDPATITRYVNRGDMPEPDGHLARSPWWWSSTIDAWQPTRPGKGAGAGRPRKVAETD